MGTWRFFRWRPITLMKFQPDPAGEAEVPERSQKRQDWVAMILVCLVNLSLSSFGGWFCFIKVIFAINTLHYICIYIYTHVLEWVSFCFASGSDFSLFKRTRMTRNIGYWRNHPLKAVASRAHPIWVNFFYRDFKIPKPEFDPKTWSQKRQYLDDPKL